MELKQLQHFVVSVDMGSLSRAAEALYTTQSHLSKTIKSLEEELGFALLDRTPSGVTVTEKGKKVYDHARKMLFSAQRIAGVKQESETCCLQLSSMPSAELARLFATFYAAQQGLSVKFQEGSLEKVLHQVSHHQVELGFIYVSAYQQQALKNMLRHKKLEFVPLLDTRLMVYVGPKNPIYERESVSWAELYKLRFVQNQEEDISLIRHVGHLRDNPTGQRPLQVAASVSNDHVMAQLLHSTDLACISCSLNCISAQDELLHAIRIEDDNSSVQLGYAKRLSQTLSEAAESFVQFLTETMGQR